MAAWRCDPWLDGGATEPHDGGGNGQQDGDAVNDLQRAGVEVQDGQQVGQHREDERAGDRPAVVAAAANQRCAADLHGRDGGKEVGVAHAKVGLGDEAGVQDARDGRYRCQLREAPAAVVTVG